MKIAITSLGETLESPIDPRFGRARFVVLYDLDSEQWTPKDNRPNAEAESGAGIASANCVFSSGAEAVVTGHCGPRAFAALAAAGISVYQDASGSVQDAIAAFRDGRLVRAGQADSRRYTGRKKP